MSKTEREMSEWRYKPLVRDIEGLSTSLSIVQLTQLEFQFHKHLLAVHQ